MANYKNAAAYGAIEEGSLKKLKFLIDLNYVYRQDIFMVQLAVKLKHKDIVEYLTSTFEYNINEACRLGLYYAILALEEKAGFLEQNNLLTIIENKHFKIISALEKRFPYIKDEYPLLFVKFASKGDIESLNYVYHISNSIPEEYLKKSLDIAAQRGHKNILEYIIENYPNINLNSALKRASLYKRLDLVKFLISKGANDLNGALFRAESTDAWDVMYYLYTKGADINLLPDYPKNRIILRKYYRRWRLIHWKKFFNKVVAPLYYSPGFAGQPMQLMEL